MKHLLRIIFIACITVLIATSCKNTKQKEETSKKDSTSVAKDNIITLENSAASLSFNLYGGAYTAFKLKDVDINPISWKFSADQMPEPNKGGAIFCGHFVCIGRWGPPSDMEAKTPIPYHGQPANILWEAVDTERPDSFVMTTHAPLEGLDVTRTILMGENQPVYKVIEEVKNVNPIGRLFNFVQHPSLGVPFLDTATIVDCNAKQGFNQKLFFPEYEFTFPIAYTDSLKTKLDIRKTDKPVNYVMSFLINEKDEYGWITATSPNSGLLIGYLWKRSDFPWIDLWQNWIDGKLNARGLEFGTAGIHQPFEKILSFTNGFHGNRSFEYIDAGETITKSFISFLIKTPKDFKGVQQVKVEGNDIIVTERDNKPSRTFTLKLTETMKF